MRNPKAALLFALSVGGLALADAGGPGPDFQPLEKARILAMQTFKGIAVYSTTPPGGGG